MTSNKMCTPDLRNFYIVLSTTHLIFHYRSLSFLLINISRDRIVNSRKIAWSFHSITQTFVKCNDGEWWALSRSRKEPASLAKFDSIPPPIFATATRYPPRNAAIIHGNYSQPKRNAYIPISLQPHSKTRYSPFSPSKSSSFSPPFPNQLLSQWRSRGL